MTTHDTKHIPEWWRETTLEEIADKIFSWWTPSTKEDSYYWGNIPWIRTQEVNFNYINDAEIKISEEWFKNSSAKWIPKDTVIIAMYGNSAWRVAFSNIEATTNQACCNFIADCSKSNPKFIFFNLLSRYPEIEWMANWAAQQNLSVWVLKELKIFLPTLPEQRAIADMLSSFDTKIELLREQNEILDKAAQTIFHEWFGRYSVESPKELPRGWRTGRLLEILRLSYWKALISENRKNDWFPVIWSSGVVWFHDEFLVNWPWIVVGRKWNMGSILWVEESFFPIDTTFYVEDLLWVNSLHYHLLLLKSLDFSKIWSDSAVPGLNRDAAYSVEIIIPNNEKILEFIQIIKPILEKKSQNNSQIQSLSRTRDELLPRLMNGEVRVI